SSAGISLKTFIASIIQTVVSGPTRSPTFTNTGDSGFGEVKKVPIIGLLITSKWASDGGAGVALATGAGAAAGAAARGSTCETTVSLRLRKRTRTAPSRR